MGRLEPGKIAAILVMPGDSLQDRQALKQVEHAANAPEPILFDGVPYPRRIGVSPRAAIPVEIIVLQRGLWRCVSTPARGVDPGAGHPCLPDHALEDRSAIHDHPDCARDDLSLPFGSIPVFTGSVLPGRHQHCEFGRDHDLRRILPGQTHD